MTDGTPHSSRSGITDQIADYINLRIDACKLSLTERLAKLSSDIAGALIFALFMTIAFAMFSLAIVLFIAYIIHSLIISLLIVAIMLMFAGFIVYNIRHRLFNNSMVRLFVSLIFERHEDGKQ